MKLSKMKREAAYRAIFEPIVDLRIKLSQQPQQGAKLDAAIAQLENQIWQKLKTALELLEN